MNMQFSYNNFDCKYMHKSQLLLLIYLFLCGWLIDIFKDPKTRKPERVKHAKPNEYLFVIMDDMSINHVLPVLDRIFSMFGVPEIVKSDNGPPFQSADFKKLHFGFSHRKITPYWPRANGECERFMQTLSKTIKSSIIKRHPYQQQLHVFLRNYRATPHPSTGVPPVTLMFNCPMKV